MGFEQQVNNYEDALKAFAIGYNKSITISSVTTNSFRILHESMENVCSGLQSIVSAFEEMKATSTSTAFSYRPNRLHDGRHTSSE